MNCSLPDVSDEILGDEEEIKQLLNNSIDLDVPNDVENMTLIDAVVIRYAALIAGKISMLNNHFLAISPMPS